jgi:hypothetical protein
VKSAAFRQRLAFGLLGVLFLASGCQTSPSKPTGLDNTRFMSLWETYGSCKAASDLNQATLHLERLSAAAQLREGGNEGFVLPLPTKLESLVTNPPRRLAVDVPAMAAACSLHTGQLALQEGRTDLARDVFASVLALRDKVSSYYVLQARAFLAQLERGIGGLLKTPSF